jgi:hypothetical protein
LAALVVAGCRLDVDVATNVSEDGSGTVAVTLRADGELVSRAPGLVADLRFDDAVTAGWTVAGPTPTADGGVTMTMTKPFATPEQATAVLAEISGPEGPLRGIVVAQQRSFARLETSVRGQLGVDALDAFGDAELVRALGGVALADRVTPQQFAQGFSVVLRFVLPGQIVATNGEAQGGTVTWRATPGTVIALEAVAELVDTAATDAKDREAWARQGQWLWLGLVTAVVAAGAVWWWRRSRPSRSAADRAA